MNQLPKKTGPFGTKSSQESTNFDASIVLLLGDAKQDFQLYPLRLNSTLSLFATGYEKDYNTRGYRDNGRVGNSNFFLYSLTKKIKNEKLIACVDSGIV